MIDPIADGVTRALHVAIDGLDARNRAISSNIANLETPDYLARRVSFEDSLRSALEDGDARRTSVTTTQSLAATRLNGNNVNIDMELMSQAETNLREQLVAQALNNKYSLLRTAMGR